MSAIFKLDYYLTQAHNEKIIDIIDHHDHSLINFLINTSYFTAEFLWYVSLLKKSILYFLSTVTIIYLYINDEEFDKFTDDFWKTIA